MDKVYLKEMLLALKSGINSLSVLSGIFICNGKFCRVGRWRHLAETLQHLCHIICR